MRAIPRFTPGLLVLLSLAVVGGARADKISPLGADQQIRPGSRARTVTGDLCSTATVLPSGATVHVDLCQAWGDYDPGAFSCSPCALPGPDVVYVLDAQPGEELRITGAVTSGSPDVRLYLATDCADPVGSCLVASDSSASLTHTLVGGGPVYLFIDTTEECGGVEVTLQRAANTAQTTWGALKAIYY